VLGLLGVLRGYFQAHQTMLQTSVSQIIEQLLNAVVSIGAAYLLVNSITYNKASRAIYGAAGSAIGTGVGVLAALIFMCYIYILNRKIIRKRIRYDSSKNIEPYRRIFMEIILLVTPVIMSTFLYNFNISLNQTIFRIMLKLTKSLTETDVTTMYGIFAGKAVVIVNIPIAIASAISMAMIPSTSDN